MLVSTSPPIRHWGPSVTPPRSFAPMICVPGPMTHGPSMRVKAVMTTLSPMTIGPCVVSKTTNGSIFAVGAGDLIVAHAEVRSRHRQHAVERRQPAGVDPQGRLLTGPGGVVDRSAGMIEGGDFREMGADPHAPFGGPGGAALLFADRQE